MRQVQHLVIDNNLRWMDVELALATKEKQGDNTIIDGLKPLKKYGFFCRNRFRGYECNE